MSLARCCCLLFCIFLVSCIEGEEEIWLERDGSGRIEASYKMPTAIMKRIGDPDELVATLQEAAARDPHVHLSAVNYTKKNGNVTLVFSGTFDDLRKLATFPQRQLRDPAFPDQPVQEEVLFGTTDLEIGLLGIKFDRSVDLSQTLPESARRAPATLLNSSFTYVLNLPAEANSSNATTRSEDGKKLTWTFLLKDYTDKPMHLQAKGKIPLPKSIWYAGILPIVFIGILFFILNKRSIRSLEASSLADNRR